MTPRAGRCGSVRTSPPEKASDTLQPQVRHRLYVMRHCAQRCRCLLMFYAPPFIYCAYDEAYILMLSMPLR